MARHKIINIGNARLIFQQIETIVTWEGEENPELYITLQGDLESQVRSINTLSKLKPEVRMSPVFHVRYKYMHNEGDKINVPFHEVTSIFVSGPFHIRYGHQQEIGFVERFIRSGILRKVSDLIAPLE